MRLEVSREFANWVARAKVKAAEGSAYHRRMLELTAIAMSELRSLEQPPTEDRPSLKRVRQSRRFPVWRTAHPFEEGVALRLVCWFPESDADSVVVTLFGGEKASMGDVFYDSVGTRADAAIEQWLHRQNKESEND